MLTEELTQKAKKTANNVAKRTKEHVESNPTSLLTVGLIIFGVLAVYKAGRAVLGVIPDVSNDPDAGGGNLEQGDDVTIVNGTISRNQAQIAAAGLLQAMDRFGTDEQRIYSILSGKRRADFTLISEAFGTPRYDGAGEAVWPAAKRNLT